MSSIVFEEFGGNNRFRMVCGRFVSGSDFDGRRSSFEVIVVGWRSIVKWVRWGGWKGISFGLLVFYGFGGFGFVSVRRLVLLFGCGSIFNRGVRSFVFVVVGMIVGCVVRGRRKRELKWFDSRRRWVGRRFDELIDSSKKFGIRVVCGRGSGWLGKCVCVKFGEEIKGSSELVVGYFGWDNGKYVFELVGDVGWRRRVEGVYVKVKVDRLWVKGSWLIGRECRDGSGGWDIGV